MLACQSAGNIGALLQHGAHIIRGTANQHCCTQKCETNEFLVHCDESIGYSPPKSSKEMLFVLRNRKAKNNCNTKERRFSGDNKNRLNLGGGLSDSYPF